MTDEQIITWLRSGDPAVVWQVQRDLLGRKASGWQATRRRMVREGWGARLMSYRRPDSSWTDKLYSPKWISTFYTMRLLVQLGFPPNNRKAVASCRLLLDGGVTESGGASLWTSDWTDTCVTAMLLSMACHFNLGDDERCSRMAKWLLGQQMSDDGWNCQHPGKARVSSFHTTLSTLEGLSALVTTGNGPRGMTSAIRSGQEYFLTHRLYQSMGTGKAPRPSFTRFSFPPRWYFDVLRGLEYFCAVDAPWDDRLSDAVELVHERRRKDGRWNSQNRHSGETYFELEPGQPSRMNTLRALRVLRWVDRARVA